jgi:hypothetical protein
MMVVSKQEEVGNKSLTLLSYKQAILLAWSIVLGQASSPSQNWHTIFHIQQL